MSGQKFLRMTTIQPAGISRSMQGRRPDRLVRTSESPKWFRTTENPRLDFQRFSQWLPAASAATTGRTTAAIVSIPGFVDAQLASIQFLAI